MTLALAQTGSGRHDCLLENLRLWSYHSLPETAPKESPKPFFHPVCTLGGNEITLFRPHDHPWHHGLTFSFAHLSGQNFWGGPTYIRGQGYLWRDNCGSIRHLEWLGLLLEGLPVGMHEQLEWRTASGEIWLAEERTFAVREVSASNGYWSLDFFFKLRNISPQRLVLGTPTTEGRPLAGYGGLFWRGPRSFNDGEILAAGGMEGPALMGRMAEWLAYIGRHDSNLEYSTLLFLDHPLNPRYPTKWFMRNSPYACVSFAPVFDEELGLDSGEELKLRYRLLVADGAWSPDRINAYWRKEWLRESAVQEFNLIAQRSV